MLLQDPVSTEAVLGWVQVFEKLGASKLARVSDRVGTNVVIIQEILLSSIIKIVPGGTGVGKVSVATQALIWWWDGDCSEAGKG